ncbi:MAG: ornithine carbamoyltransferase [Acidobacteria bacterium]|nr:ornithine carbamoyltransferase [Acidobacteriota bacterium]
MRRVTHKDFIEIHDYTADEVQEIFDIARDMKAAPRKFYGALERQTLAMIFEKSSTRTRVSFETGMYQLGGQALFLS